MMGRLIEAVYPACCILCSQPGIANRDLCRACEKDLVENRHACMACALPLPASAGQQLCGQCLQKMPLYDSAWSPFIYAQPLEWMIQQLKFNHRLAYSRVLSDLLIDRLPDISSKPDCIIPVPLHNKRLAIRGFNQSLEIIRPVARSLAIPVDDSSCQRSKYSEAQSGMDAMQRRKNIRGVFSINGRLPYEHVIVFDDIVTTGSTVTELTRLIKRQGVARVDVWSLARADKIFK